jgi:hypothetical protein
VPTADRQKATVRVRMAFDQLDPRILPDMGVRVDFLSEEKAGAASSETPCDRVGPGVGGAPRRRDRLRARRQGRCARARAVRVGRTSSDSVELLSGVRAGERVVTTGHEQLSDGQRVRVN